MLFSSVCVCVCVCVCTRACVHACLQRQWTPGTQNWNCDTTLDSQHAVIIGLFYLFIFLNDRDIHKATTHLGNN